MIRSQLRVRFGWGSALAAATAVAVLADRFTRGGRPARGPGRADQPLPSGLPHRFRAAARAGRAYDLPARGRPGIGVLWTYADRQPDGGFHRLGGGSYDAAANTYGQGAFNADDISRAAVVYVRHWRSSAMRTAGTRPPALLRGLTYLQDVSGADAGNVVLWMQPMARCIRVRSREIRPTRPTADPRSGSRERSGRSARATRRFTAATRRSPDSSARGSILAIHAINRQSLIRATALPGRRWAAAAAWLIADDAARRPRRCWGCRRTSARGRRIRLAARWPGWRTGLRGCRPAALAAGVWRDPAVGDGTHDVARVGIANADGAGGRCGDVEAPGLAAAGDR